MRVSAPMLLLSMASAELCLSSSSSLGPTPAEFLPLNPQPQAHPAFVSGPALRWPQLRTQSSRASGAAAVRCDLHRDDVATKKDTLRVPATSVLNWREYRARLIQAETPVFMRRASLNTGVWSHEISEIERGCLLIEVPQHADQSPEKIYTGEETLSSQDHRVIFLVQHDDEHGSYGLILNKPTPCTIGDFTEKLPHFADNTIHFGGEGHRALEGHGPNRELHALHSVRGLLGSEEVMDGVFVGADVKHASELVSQRKARANQFKFYYSATCWAPGELEQEVDGGKWVAAACSKEFVLQSSSYWEKPLWNMVLGVMGGKHGLMSREFSDEL